MERSFEAWEEVQRHGQDLMDRVAQGVTGFIQSQIVAAPPVPFHWPPAPAKAPFVLDEIGGRLGQAGNEIGNYFNGVVQQFFRQLPPPFRHEDDRPFIDPRLVSHSSTSPSPVEKKWDVANMGLVVAQIGDQKVIEPEQVADLAIGTVGEVAEDDRDEDLEGLDSEVGFSGQFKRPHGTVNITATYDNRSRETETSVVARGDLWRVEASRGGNITPGSDRSSLLLVQLGPVLFVRDSTLLLPIHLSKQHLLWYGYDRKNGLHSLCPAVWSKHRRWLLMSMICLNPLACSFMDLQFPNGQLTYVAGEGFTSSAFVPILGGLLQAQGKYPGETRISFSFRNKLGTRVTPMIRLPDKSFSVGVDQPMAWKQTGIMIKPSVQLSLCRTFGGSNPGSRAELVHSIYSLKEDINVICGFSSSTQPSVFTSLAIGRSKWNGNVGKSGVVISLETPLNNMRNPCLSVQLNGGFEF
ncbi:epstein-barr nuclear antigen [Rhynchospora pubera]|uniref:Epstein-barr nuclear antigen n=1 Tax=Rhynchospora pubera TaxID=906938 RepID=A0AAV8DW77_9POAL|nr:epstein-barr nuclear antigen [Rhynchospora pubera]